MLKNSTSHNLKDKIERLSFALNAAGIGTWEIDPINTLVSCDERCRKLFGFPTEDPVHLEQMLNYIHPDDRQSVSEAVAQALNPHSGGLYDIQFKTNGDEGGKVRWLYCRGKAYFNAVGQPYRFTGTAQAITVVMQQLTTGMQVYKQATQNPENLDHTSSFYKTFVGIEFTEKLRNISSEIEAMQALAKTEILFKNVTNSSPTGLWLSDEEGGLIYLNKTLVEWTGLPYDALLGAGWANAIIEVDRQRSIETFLNALTSREHYDVMFRIKKSDGSIIWCRASGDPYYHENGSYAGYAGYCMDLDELVAGREALQHSESKFRSLIEEAPVATCLFVGRDLKIEVANNIMIGYWGKDRSVIGSPLEVAVPELKGQPFLQILDDVFSTGKTYEAKAALAELKLDGELNTYYFDFTYKPLMNANGEVYAIMDMAVDVTEQVVNRKALEASEAKLRSVIATAPAAIGLFVGRDLIVEMPNQAFIDIVGKGPDIVGKPLREVMPELENQAYLQILEEVYTSGTMFQSFETQIDVVQHGAMTHNFYNITFTPLFNADAEVYAVLEIAIDVTEAVRVRQKVEESELFSRSIFNHSPVAKLVFEGEDMVIKTINANMLEMLGRDSSIIGMRFMEAIPEFVHTPLMDRLRQVFTTGETYNQPEERFELIRYGQPYFGYYSYIYKAMHDTAGKIYGVMLTATEVTDQVLARQKVEEAENNLRGAIELAELGTWQIDLATGILDYSERLREWFGIEKDEVVTIERAYLPIREQDRPLVKASIMHAISPGTNGIYDVEYIVNEGKEGKERILHAQGKTFFNENNEPYKISGTVQDVTTQRTIQLELENEVQRRTEELWVVNEELTATNKELYESNERLTHSNEELAQYAYVASHDLQEPLRKIRMFSSMVVKHADLPQTSKVLIDKINQSSERMTLLIQNLLDFSRLLKSDTLMRPIDLATIVDNVINDFELAIEEKKAVIHVGKLPVIEAVDLQMNQFFYNLLSNSLKFTRPGIIPKIEIEAQSIKLDEVRKHITHPLSFANYYHITFADNGIGFETQYSEQVFEVFKRLHGSDIYPGSGIGLALCRRIISNHGGHLWVASEVGKGTTFHIILPDKSYIYQSIIPEGDTRAQV